MVFSNLTDVSILSRLVSRELQEEREELGELCKVSILSRLVSRELLQVGKGLQVGPGVSILSRLVSRELPPAKSASKCNTQVSILSRLVSRELPFGTTHSFPANMRFNPLPAGKPGATFPLVRSHSQLDGVSILSRLVSRELHPIRIDGNRVTFLFQSSPGW